jgi:hypothetical protein
LLASKSGYGLFSGTIHVSPGAFIRRDLILWPLAEVGAGPRITHLGCKYPGAVYFLDRIKFDVTFTANVDWAGHPPGIIQFRTPKGNFEAPAAEGRGTRSFNMGSDFGPGGLLQAVAISADGTRSAVKTADMVIMPFPLPADLSGLFTVSDRGSGYAYSAKGGLDISFIEQGVDAGIIPKDIPIFGKEGLGLQFVPQIECEIESNGQAEFQLKWSDLETGKIIDKEWGRQHNLKKITALLEDYDRQGRIDRRRLPRATVAGFELCFYPIAAGAWQFDRRSGSWTPVDFEAGLAGEVSASKSWPFIFMAGPIPVPMYAKARVELSAELTAQVLGLDPILMNGDFLLNPYARGSLGAGIDEVLAVEGWVGGGAELELQWPEQPTLKEATIYIDAGIKLYAFLFQWEGEGLRWDWPEKRALGLMDMEGPGMTLGPAPIPRDYLESPDYGRFLGGRSAGIAAAGVTGLASKMAALQTQVFPYSEPKCAAAGTNFGLVWLYDNPERSTNNRTMTVFSKFDGIGWSEPVPLANDGTADFHPQLLAFPDGWAVASWENESAVLPETASFEDMKANLEIAVSWFNPVSNRWQAAQGVTANTNLDRSPKLAGRSKDDVMLVWISNLSNHTSGGSAAPNQLWCARWNSVAWGNPQLVATVTNALLKYDVVFDGANSSPAALVEFRTDSLAGTNLFSQSLTNLTPGEAIDINFVWHVSGLVENLDLVAVLSGVNAATDFDLENNSMRLAIQRITVPVNLWLGPLIKLPSGAFQITVWGEAGRNYEIQSSTNLVDWTSLTNIFATNTVMQIIDTTGTNWDRQFYRAVRP